MNVGGGNPGTHQVAVGHRPTGFIVLNEDWVEIQGFEVNRAEDRGIRVNTGCQVTENSCFANAGATPTFAGIRAMGPSNRIEANVLHQNGTGVMADAGGNMIIRNSFSFNNFRVTAVAGNNVAQMIVVPGNNFVSTDPQANLAY